MFRSTCFRKSIFSVLKQIEEYGLGWVDLELMRPRATIKGPGIERLGGAYFRLAEPINVSIRIL